MILEDIKNKLLEVDENVFYGMVHQRMNETLWNYIVFDRSVMSINANKTGYTDKFTVHIIREEWIPEEVVFAVIDKMLEIPGMKLAGNDATYDYFEKPKTNVVIEMLSIDFVKQKKKV